MSHLPKAEVSQKDMKVEDTLLNFLLIWLSVISCIGKSVIVNGRFIKRLLHFHSPIASSIWQPLSDSPGGT